MFKLLKYSFFLFLFLFDSYYSFSQVTASFTVDINEGCPPLFVTFTNTSSNGNNFQWDFGNNKSSEEENPSTTYTETGNYNVKLIADNGSSFDTIVIVDLINVFEKPGSNFSENSLSNYCEDDNEIEFTNLSNGANTFFWDFGDGNFSSDINTTHQFSQDGEFLVKLKASNEYCDSLFSIPITINPTPLLTALVDENFTCDSNYNFNFSANSSNSTIIDWNWEFGNNSVISSENQQQEFSYNETGVFFPKLIATSNHNCVDSFFLDSIFIPHQYSYEIQSSSSLSGCPPLLVDFEITPLNSIELVTWDFGDGNIVDGNSIINKSYQNSGSFNINSTLTDTNGCIQNLIFNETIVVDITPSGEYSVSNSTGCPPLDVEFNVTTDPTNTILWEFGDTLSASLSNQNVENTYVYNSTFYPTLALTSPNGCVTEYNVGTVQAGLTLTNFTADPPTGCAMLEVDFINSAPDFVTDFFWDFGDGNTSIEPNPTHVYDTIGEYTVTFRCSDTSGCSSQYVINNMITTYGEDDVELPNQDTIFACSPYTFTADASNIGESYWNWDFGDGNFGSGANINHQYTESGIYNVLLNADAPNSCMYNILNYATIVIDDNIEIDLDITINTECDNGFIDVINNSTGVTDHLWDMGDGGVVRTADINHSYSTSKSYLVSYQALSESGCLVVQTIAVIFSCDEDANPIPELEPIIIVEDTTEADTLISGPLIDPITSEVITQTCGPELINLNTPYPDADSVFWDFGDGYTSSEPNPTHLYQTAGTFDLNHYGFYPNGDVDTLTIKNFIDQYMLDASFTLDKENLCNEAKYEFENLSPSTTSWEWKIDTTIITTESSGNIIFPLNDSVKILSLKIEDDYGCINESQQSLFLYQPLVLIEDTNFACNSIPANFIASVIGDPDHYWMLDNDTLGTDTSLNHAFIANGIFQVKLQLDDQGCIREIPIDSIEIYQPDASFSPYSSSPICNTDSILFIANNRLFNSNKYNWSGAKVLNSGDSTWIQFNDEGKQVISLSITDNSCTNIISSDSIIVNKASAYYSYNQINYCFPINVEFEDSSVNPVDWEWNFGENQISNEENPFHTFNSMPSDSIKLTITDINGCRDSTKSFLITELNADFSADDTVICANSPVVFNTMNDIVNTWDWDFGDGSSSNDSIPIHSYENAGMYEVTLSVSDGQGCSDIVVKSNYIEVQKVEADFVFSIPNECPSVTVFFTNNSTGGSNFLWDFGDGAMNIENNNSIVAHEYDSIGYFHPTLIASNEGGCIDTLIATDTLIIPGPLLNFSVDQIGDCDSLTIIISDSSINTIDYTWDFGDGNSSLLNPNDTTITHTYNSPGIYNIILIGLDAANCPNTYISPDTIKHYITPIIDISITEPNVCIGSSLSIVNNTLAENHNWIYNDQTFSDQTPDIFISNQGVNEIYYKVSNGDDHLCSDSTIYTVIGHQTPDATINSEASICENLDYFTLNSEDSGGQWSGDYIDNNTGEINLLESGAGIFNFTYEILGYCPTQSDNITIEVVGSPNIDVTINDTNICISSIISPINNTMADNHIWSYGNQTFDDSNPEISINLEGSNQLTYTASNGVNNCSNSSIYNLVGHGIPNPTINSDSIVCENLGLYTLSSTESGGIWSGLNINNISGEIDLSANGPGFFEFFYEISGYCPTQIDSITIEIIELIEAEINPILDFCEQTDTIQLTASPGNGLWSGLNNTHLNNGLFIIDSLQDGLYNVYYTTSNSCPDTDTSIIVILPQPEVNVEIIQEKPCVSFPVNIVNNSSNLFNERYSWFINDSLYYDSVINFTEPYFLLDTGFYELKTVITNQYNCKIEHIFNDSIMIYDTSALKNPEIIRTTVFNNSSVYSEWKDTTLSINPLSKNILFRKVNDEDFEFIVELDSNIHHYMDDNVDVFNNSYTYYIISKNTCETNSNSSNIGNSILLRLEAQEDLKTRLYWNGYNYWEDGINRYEIQKLNINNEWDVIKTIENTVNSTIINE